MSGQNSAAPIIIKRKKVVAGHGHHGGAWKVAFADFATAMMAFFLMMWLLGATSESQRRGLADYFNPSIPIHRISSGGEGLFGGDDLENTANMGPTTARDDTNGAEDSDSGAEVGAFEEIESRIEAMSGESTLLQDALRHVLTRVTDEGLVIEMFDLPGAPLFREDSDEPMQVLRVLAGIVQQVITMVSNPLAIEGHSRSYTLVMAADPVWSLSQARAERMRQLMLDTGAQETRIARTAAHADRRLVHDNPMAVRNNRLELILLRSRL
jgi:chemotaxis protein MotB